MSTQPSLAPMDTPSSARDTGVGNAQFRHAGPDRHGEHGGLEVVFQSCVAGDKYPVVQMCASTRDAYMVRKRCLQSVQSCYARAVNASSEVLPGKESAMSQEAAARGMDPLVKTFLFAAAHKPSAVRPRTTNCGRSGGVR
jgi:hypothetical protein